MDTCKHDIRLDCSLWWIKTLGADGSLCMTRDDVRRLLQRVIRQLPCSKAWRHLNATTTLASCGCRIDRTPLRTRLFMFMSTSWPRQQPLLDPEDPDDPDDPEDMEEEADAAIQMLKTENQEPADLCLEYFSRPRDTSHAYYRRFVRHRVLGAISTQSTQFSGSCSSSRRDRLSLLRLCWATAGSVRLARLVTKRLRKAPCDICHRRFRLTHRVILGDQLRRMHNDCWERVSRLSKLYAAEQACRQEASSATFGQATGDERRAKAREWHTQMTSISKH